MEAIEELTKLSQSMSLAAAVLADEDVDEKTPTKRPSTFLNAVALGNVGAGKSAVLNSLIGHPVLPMGENGATRAPISIDLQRDPAVSSKSIMLQSGGKSQEVSASSLRHSLQDTLSKGSGKSRGNEIHLKLRTSTGFLFKKSGKASGWSRRWFVLNEKSGKLGYTKKQEERHFRGVITLEECNIEEIDEDEVSKSSKDSKKKGGDDSGKGPSLVFKITSKVPYKTVLKAHSALILKAESLADKVEWVNKIGNIIQPSKGMPAKSMPASEGGSSIRHSESDGSLDTMARKPVDPEEELRWMSQEVRGYVEAVLNSLAANIPKAVVLCQVKKAKDDMLNQLYTSVSSQSTARIEELIQEDQNVKVKRELIQRQSSLLSKLTSQLSVHDNRAAAATWSDSGTGTGS